MIWLVKNWSRVNFWLLRHICNLRYEVIGAEKIGHGPLLVASKHQSLWETFALMTVFDDPAYILKRELIWIPFFGWCAWKAEMIPVDRGAGSQALADMTDTREERGRAQPPAHHLPGRNAPRAGRGAEIQIRRRASLFRDRRAVPAGGAQFGSVLAAPLVPALSRNDQG